MLPNAVSPSGRRSTCCAQNSAAAWWKRCSARSTKACSPEREGSFIRKTAKQQAPAELWRISNHADLTGAGGLRYSARWHTAGRPIVYLAATPAGALLEVLVHLELEEATLPRHYQLLRVVAAGSVAIEDLRVPSGESWKRRLAITRALGDAWLQSGRTAVARVPSATLPHTTNYLLNPRHPAAASLRIAERQRARFDSRLL